MVEFKTKSGKRVLINPDTIISVLADDESNCRIYTLGADAEPWFVKGTIDEIKAMLRDHVRRV